MTQQLHASAARQHPLNVAEVLERILCLLDHDDIINARLVSRFWCQTAYRPYWQFPNLKNRGIQAILGRLVRHGQGVLALDFTRANIYSPDPLQAVDDLTSLCPNVQELSLAYGTFTFTGVRRLIFHYKHQLRVLRLDLSRTRQQPYMDLLTCLKALECLELKTNRSTMHASFINYDELFKACPRLWELIITPAPYFSPDPVENGVAPQPLTFHQEILSHPLVQHNNQTAHHHHTLFSGRNTTTASLEAFVNNDLSRLRRLWLSIVWFSADHIRTLARACPNLTDLRLSYRDSTDFGVPMPNIPFATYLECWPKMRSLWIDGTHISLPKQQQHQRNTHRAIESPSLAPIPLQNLPPVHLTTLSLSRVNTLTDQGLMQVVDVLGTKLSRLNVDKCLQLTDTGIRYVLMHSPALVRLSAAELNLTMNLFEDDDEILDTTWRDHYKRHFAGTGRSPAQHPIRGHFYEDHLPNRTWACVTSLKTLDLSWRETDSRPEHIKPLHATQEYQKYHTTDVHPVAFPVYHANGSSSPSSASSAITPWGSARNAHGQPYTFEYCSLAEIERWQSYNPLKIPGWKGSYQPLFRKKYRLASMYHRLRQLVNLEVLLLQGWTIPWRACDLVAFTPPSIRDGHSVPSPYSLEPVYRAQISMRKWQGDYRIQALDGYILPDSDDERLTHHLLHDGFIPNLRHIDISLHFPKNTLDPHHDGGNTSSLSAETDKEQEKSDNSSEAKTTEMEPSEYAQYSVWAAWIATCPRLKTIVVKPQWLNGQLNPPPHDDVQIRLLKKSEAPSIGQESEITDPPVLVRSAVCTETQYPTLSSYGWAAFMS
ncbi:hypothetical protein BGW41_005952 [Actinomortierella wolfii]|nr:hypothetical protein BGW41_005952 [Actinomortierella wolfii]